MRSFYLLFGFNCLAPLVFFFFFFIGLLDGTINSRNLLQWSLILLLFGVLLYSGHWLYQHGRASAAWTLGIIQAVPSVLVLVAILIMIFGNVRWN